MRNLEEKTVTTKTIYEGKIIRLSVDDVKLPNGQVSKREIVNHPGAVGVLAVTSQNKLVMVRQFRKALEKTIWEIPAGKMEQGEDPAQTAHRELKEETGYQADQLIHLTSIYTSPGFADEYVHLYQAKGLEKGEQRLDQDEFVELMELSKAECLAAIRSGDICDAKTMVAIYEWIIQS